MADEYFDHDRAQLLVAKDELNRKVRTSSILEGNRADRAAMPFPEEEEVASRAAGRSKVWLQL